MGRRAVQPVPASPADVPVLVAALRRALDGDGPVLAPVPTGSSGASGPVGAVDLPDVAVVLSTSGSTGAPRAVGLTAANLRASADATHAVLAGPGRWTLAVPAHHVAGMQVLVRSVLAGTDPIVVPGGPFTADSLRAAHDAAGPTAAPEYVSLVPTQLVRVLGSPRATEDLAGYAAVLVGGAAAPPGLLARARAAGVAVVTTYGMTETAGGCVYDGRPLPGVRVGVDSEGRVSLGGPTVAAGYLPDEPFPVDGDGTPWFRTNDAGDLGPDGRLTVSGRLDDVVNTGGVKVRPAAVEAALLDRLPGVREAVVLGVPDPHWGQAVAAVLVCEGPAGWTLEQVRRALRGRVDDAALPRRVVVVDALPTRGPGKPDRDALRLLLADAETYDQG